MSDRPSLTEIAEKLEAELKAYNTAVADLRKVEITSEKTLQRARRELERCAIHEERLAELLPAFAHAMLASQSLQEQCMKETAALTEKLKERFESRNVLLERIAAIGLRAREINEPITSIVEAQGQPETGDAKTNATKLLESLAVVTERAEAVIAEADALQKQAADDAWLDIARSAEELKSQLQSARNRLLIARRNIAEQSPS